MQLNKSKEVDQFIEELPEHTQDLTKRLRELVFDTSQNLTEQMKWGMPCYSKTANICYLQTAKNHVNLGFYFGAFLKDKENLLEGTGKKMRHIRIKKQEDILPEKFIALIENAIELDT